MFRAFLLRCAQKCKFVTSDSVRNRLAVFGSCAYRLVHRRRDTDDEANGLIFASFRWEGAKRLKSTNAIVVWVRHYFGPSICFKWRSWMANCCWLEPGHDHVMNFTMQDSGRLEHNKIMLRSFVLSHSKYLEHRLALSREHMTRRSIIHSAWVGPYVCCNLICSVLQLW
jgi:hypothetical protein